MKNANNSKLDLKIEGKPFSGIEAFPRSYHDADYYRKKARDNDNQIRDILKELGASDFVESVVLPHKEETEG